MSYDFLYPLRDDEEFNVRIAKRKEFNDTKFIATEESVQAAADKACRADFELAPHQVFVRNFLSSQTPYNGLLLYHDLGTGKTCTAIGVAEETRAYMRQMGSTARILVVASPNVQDNFRLQLFDEKKLQEADGLWDIRSCNGSKMLKEVNPMNVRGLSRERVVRLVNRLINDHYMFLGYLEFVNYINRVADGGRTEAGVVARLKRHFEGRLIIVDEAHNIRMSGDVATKRVATGLQYLVDRVQGMKLVFLSATPMYNSPTEIIWLMNLLNKNDRRPVFRVADVFSPGGEMKAPTEEDPEGGKDKLIRMTSGYVSYVRGQSPYAFPFRVWPDVFAPASAYANSVKPRVQITGTPIDVQLQYLSTFMLPLGDVQAEAYGEIIRRLRAGTLVAGQQSLPDFANMEGIGYTLLQRPLEALNIAYPAPDFATAEARDLVGKGGLERLLTFELGGTPPRRKDYRYRNDADQRVFDRTQLGRYSAKINQIVSSVNQAAGISLIYSQYIDGGVVPCALALEQAGYRRYGGPSLWAADELPADATQPGSYVIISGDRTLSPDNTGQVRAATGVDNRDGSIVKAIIISQAGAEGLDFKNVRQVHVLEPWYNLNRIEQIVGRAVRNLSHCSLPFAERNVELYLYGSLLKDAASEAADMYVYRHAEAKAIQIGKVQRVLKESSVDCILNKGQQSFTSELLGQRALQRLASGEEVALQLGSQPYSSACDYMKECLYSCIPDAEIGRDDVSMDTFSESFIQMNNDKIIQRVKALFRERHFYTRASLYSLIRALRSYPIIQIDSALEQMTSDRNEFVTDIYGRLGRLENAGDLYYFSPLEITGFGSDLRSRSVPLDVKPRSLPLDTAPPPLPSAVAAADTTHDGERAVLGFIQAVETGMSPSPEGASRDSWLEMAYGARKYLLGVSAITNAKCDIWTGWHVFEQLAFDDQIAVLNAAAGSAFDSEGPRGRALATVGSYLDVHKLTAAGKEGLMLATFREAVLVVRRDGHWTPGEPEDYAEFGEAISERASTFLPVGDKLAPYVGFMAPFKSERMVFKVKDTSKLRNRGARCDQASKKGAMALVNLLAGRELMTLSRSLPQAVICVAQEFILRAYQEDNKDGKRWFSSAGFASFMKLETIGK